MAGDVIEDIIGDIGDWGGQSMLNRTLASAKGVPRGCPWTKEHIPH